MQDFCRDITAMLCKVKRDLFEDIADPNTTAEMRGCEQGVLTVDSEKVQVSVQQQ
jgi:hypothetical protein